MRSSTSGAKLADADQQVLLELRAEAAPPGWGGGSKGRCHGRGGKTLPSWQEGAGQRKSPGSGTPTAWPGRWQACFPQRVLLGPRQERRPESITELTEDTESSRGTAVGEPPRHQKTTSPRPAPHGCWGLQLLVLRNRTPEQPTRDVRLSSHSLAV